MPSLGTWQVRQFGPAASTISLAKHGGAVLGGIWVSSKGTSPTLVAYDASASATAAVIVNSFVPAPPANYQFGPEGGIGCGTGLCVKTASCTGSILWRPPSY